MKLLALTLTIVALGSVSLACTQRITGKNNVAQLNSSIRWKLCLCSFEM